MARVLSQDEIDVLLSALGGEEKKPEAESERTEGDGVQEKATLLYDFRHPGRMSREQIRTLESINQRFARNIGASLSSRLMMMADVSVVSIRQMTYAEAISSMPDPSCIYVFALRTPQEEAILFCNPELTFFVVDRLFGGEGGILETRRAITVIEQTVMGKIVDVLLDHLRKIWQDICKLSMEVKAFHTNPGIVHIAPAGELMVTISLELKIRDFSTGLSFCLPVMFLEEVLPKERQQLQAYQRTGTNDVPLMKRTIQQVDLPITVQLGNAQISFRDLSDLRPGDVVRLDQKTEDEATVLVGNKVKFYGFPGIVGDRRGVQIIRAVSSE